MIDVSTLTCGGQKLSEIEVKIVWFCWFSCFTLIGTQEILYRKEDQWLKTYIDDWRILTQLNWIKLRIIWPITKLASMQSWWNLLKEKWQIWQKLESSGHSIPAESDCGWYPEAMTASTIWDGLRTPQAEPREGVWVLRMPSLSSHTLECPAKRPSPVSRLFS